MNPKLRSIAPAMAKLNHALDDRADKLLKRIDATEGHSSESFASAHKELDAADQALADVDSLITSLKGTNGGPLPASPDGEPQASWQNTDRA